jgi:Phage tail assembly chaperone
MGEKVLFKLEPAPTFWAPVSIPLPGGETGEIRVKFRYRNRDAFVELLKEAATLDDVDMLLRVIDDWDGPDAAFSPETLGRLLGNYQQAGRALFRAYRDNLLGAAEKN